MRIGILQTGRVPDELTGAYADYDGFFCKLFDGLGFEFTTYAVLDGVFPKLPLEQDGWIITGSKFAVYENHSWIPPLEDLIRDIAASDQKMIGICFGHQIIAKALGGKVEKAKEGWVVGATTYQVISGERTLNAWHRDQVTKRPPKAKVLASNSHCKFAALQYGETIRTWQPHPEFSTDFVKDLLNIRKDLVGAQIAESVTTKPLQPIDCVEVAEELATFLMA